MKAKIWLRPKTKHGKWSYGLGRLANGMIVVAECFAYPSGFGVVGSSMRTVPIRLNPGEKDMIVRDLHRACCEYLGLEVDK